jgi:hypothetical protein
LQNQATTLSFIFCRDLRPYENVDVIYKRDEICFTSSTFSRRDFYFIVTNTDGDSVVEATDAAYSWVTRDFPDGDYWVVVTACDAADNCARDSMLVTIVHACGDCNADGRITIADANYIVSCIYRGGSEPAGDGDVNLDASVTVADANYLVSYIYRSGPPPCEPILR